MQIASRRSWPAIIGLALVSLSLALLPGGAGLWSSAQAAPVMTVSPLTGQEAVRPAAIGSLDWYFAEGFTGTGFDEYLTINNPGAASGLAYIYYYVEGEASSTDRTVSLPANSRVTVPVHGDYNASSNPGGLGRKTAGHSTKVTTTVPTVIERPMYFTYVGAGFTAAGGHNVLGAARPDTTWSFAEGYTGTGFDEFLTIMNPGSAGSATITYYVETEPTATERIVSLPANSRVTVVVHGDFNAGTNPGGLGRKTGGHSTKVVTTVPTVVERPMYFNYGGSLGSASGGHNVMGAPSAPEPLACRAELNGANERPTPVVTDGLGLVRLSINTITGQIEADWLLAGLSSNITAAHIHTGAAGVAGPIFVGFSGLPAAGGAFTTSTTATTAQAAAIATNPVGYYVNVHTADNTGGEIRGQLTCTQPTVCRATLLGANEVPPVVGGGNGAVRLLIDAALGHVRGEWLTAGLTGNITAAHIHPGAAGIENPPVINFTPDVRVAGGAFATLTGTNTAQAEAILANPSAFYVNVHTAANPDGEMRGQLSCSANG